MKKIKPNKFFFILICVFAIALKRQFVFAQNVNSSINFEIINRSKVKLYEKDFNLNLISSDGKINLPGRFYKNWFSFEKENLALTNCCSTKLIYKSNDIVFKFEIDMKEILANDTIEIEITNVERIKDSESVFSYNLSFQHVTLYNIGIYYRKSSFYFQSFGLK